MTRAEQLWNMSQEMIELVGDPTMSNASRNAIEAAHMELMVALRVEVAMEEEAG